MRTLLEILRIIIVFGILGSICWAIIGNLYTINGATETYTWLGALAIFILLFVLYRNKLQFSGWYSGKGRYKLHKKVSFTLILLSSLLIILPFILGYLFS
ncbi:hypothetical protein [Aquibacillus rhizosphaerae]|uniref:DUF3899 domain-containing protein n=1 Tax=Aquibacillus rhizosphaerae TaxID=3051431 RepID=A0ABT7L1T1_9BACI|nr:hypothetical protein [Aquibacillus sp. LR5S19]MDL4839802.1 hypothetical protein [Aquibacillus sp. LR5S19]